MISVRKNSHGRSSLRKLLLNPKACHSMHCDLFDGIIVIIQLIIVTRIAHSRNNAKNIQLQILFIIVIHLIIVVIQVVIVMILIRVKGSGFMSWR